MMRRNWSIFWAMWACALAACSSPEPSVTPTGDTGAEDRAEDLPAPPDAAKDAPLSVEAGGGDASEPLDADAPPGDDVAERDAAAGDTADADAADADAAGEDVGCPAGQMLCGVGCADLQTNRNHCGACAVVCQTNGGTSANACAMGVCTPACASGWGNCDGDPANGCEANLNTNTMQCGMCGRQCGMGEVCVAGACACPTGFSNCGGVCLPTGGACMSSGSGGCEQRGTVMCAPSGSSTVCSARPRAAGQSCTAITGGVCDSAGTCVCPMGQQNCEGRCLAAAPCTSRGSGGCEMQGTTTCSGACSAAPRTSGGCGAVSGGVCDSAGNCACPGGQTNCGGVCQSTGGPCTSAGSGGCAQSGVLMCSGSSTRCSVGPRTSGPCSSPSGGVCDTSGSCVCPGGQTNCGGTCRVTNVACTSSGSGGCAQSGTIVCSGSGTACTAVPRTSGSCSSPAGGVCGSDGRCACPAAAPGNWTFLTSNGCGPIRSNITSPVYGHCCGFTCPQPNPWVNTWSPPSCPTGYRAAGCGAIHYSGGGSETLAGCTVSQYCAFLEGSAVALYAICVRA